MHRLIEFDKTMRFLKLTWLHSEAIVRGKEWIRSRIADLKIDLWLATEHGEQERSTQVDDIQCEIETLDNLLWPSIFDTHDIGGHSLQCAAADLARYAICIMYLDENGAKKDHRARLVSARAFLDTADAHDEAHKCMRRIDDRPGVLFEDVSEVVEKAGRLIETLLA